jgi:hypothetical protein
VKTATMQTRPARNAEAADALRTKLAQGAALVGSVVDFRIATDGMRIKSEGGVAAGAGQPDPAGAAAFCWPKS